MKTFCKSKNKQRKCKKRNRIEFELIATHQCSKCGRLADCKKRLCKPKRIKSLV